MGDIAGVENPPTGGYAPPPPLKPALAVTAPADRSPEPDWLQALNPEQRRAATMPAGPLCILAGAGTGKTRTLTARVCCLLAAQPWQEMLIVTFTNKAARELQDRIGRSGYDSCWIGTFHSISLKLLRTRADILSLESRFSIIDAEEQRRLLKDLIRHERRNGMPDVHPRRVLEQIERWKDQCWAPESVPERLVFGPDDKFLRRLYRLYQDALVSVNAADFSDLICGMVWLLEEDSERASRLRGKFAHVLVDEFQDTNHAQYRWLKGFARASGSLCVVGDDDQSIYAWRGAEIENFRHLVRDFPSVKQVVLQRNYRSTETILRASSSLIAHNRQRVAKKLVSGIAGNADRLIDGHNCLHSGDEALAVAEIGHQLRTEGEPLGQIAVLVRANLQFREIEEALLARRLPYQIKGGLRFYEREETRDVLSYFRLLVRDRDQLAFFRIVNKPARGIGPKLCDLIRQEAGGGSCLQAVRDLLAGQSLQPRQSRVLKDFVALVDRLREALAASASLPEFARSVIVETGLLARWQAERSPDAAKRVENLLEIPQALTSYRHLEEFLEHVELIFDAQDESGENRSSMKLMTIHAAKGLEFDHVLLPGWSDGLFPIISEDDPATRIEEERRLAYVALTRARKSVSVFHAARRTIYGKTEFFRPSRFLSEIDPACMRQIRVQPTWGSPGPAAETANSFQAGDRCFSERFGSGVVLAVKAGQLLDIRFDAYDMRMTLLASFVKQLPDKSG